ncbi:MADS-box transcription factor [Parasponia andersonii]|uniref:MADS-box transcription factor n=1 Tax=Parasponia andersonii TaxID=3476 RepID=A0A2P5D5Q4_PARAD|nr:MADS-box transcription factor [Parasponia andersonii]
MAKRSRDNSSMEEEQEQERAQLQASNIFVSFSKRRKGLFQKAAELCTKCHAQIAIVVLSPTGNPFSFGHSSVDDVLRHYLSNTTMGPPNFITDEHRNQTQRIEGLKFSLKQKKPQINDRETRVVSELKRWVERECEERKTVAELEFLREKFNNLLGKITQRLASSSTTCLGGGGEKDQGFDSVCPMSTEFVQIDNMFQHFNTASNLDLGFVDHPINDMSYTKYGTSSNFPLNGFTCQNRFQFHSSDLEFLGHPLNDVLYANDVGPSSSRGDAGSHADDGFNCQTNADFITSNDMFQFTSSDLEFLDHSLNDISYANYGFTFQDNDFVGNDNIYQFNSSNLEFLDYPLNATWYASCYGS